MAYLQLAVERVRRALIREVTAAQKTYSEEMETYQQTLRQNEEFNNKMLGAIIRIYVELLDVWNSTNFKWGRAKPYRDNISVTFSIQPSKEVRDDFQRQFPELQYNWIKQAGHLGEIRIPNKIAVGRAPDRNKMSTLEEMLHKLPEHGWVKLSQQQADELHILYQQDELIHELT